MVELSRNSSTISLQHDSSAPPAYLSVPTPTADIPNLMERIARLKTHFKGLEVECRIINHLAEKRNEESQNIRAPSIEALVEELEFTLNIQDTDVAKAVAAVNRATTGGGSKALSVTNRLSSLEARIQSQYKTNDVLGAKFGLVRHKQSPSGKNFRKTSHPFSSKIDAKFRWTTGNLVSRIIFQSVAYYVLQ